MIKKACIFIKNMLLYKRGRKEVDTNGQKINLKKFVKTIDKHKKICYNTSEDKERATPSRKELIL